MKRNLLMLLLATAFMLSSCSAFLPASDPLNGTSWQLAEIAGKPALSAPKVTLEFKDGQAGGNAGCNSYGGDYQVNGNKIGFSQMISTMMACADQSVMDQESAYLQILGGAQSFEIVDGRLQLHGSGGETLTFVPLS